MLASPSRLGLSNIGRFVESPGRTTASQTARRTEVAGAQVRGARRIGGRRVRRRPQAEKCAGRCRPLARGNLDPLSVSLAASPAGRGDVAQVVEHRLCKAGVRGSSPLVSTHYGPRNHWPLANPRAESRLVTVALVHNGYTSAERAAASSASATSSSRSPNRCPYRSKVMVADLWPSICWTTFTSAPEAMAGEAAVCLSSGGCIGARLSRSIAASKPPRRVVVNRAGGGASPYER